MVLSAEVRRERRRATAAPFPRPRGRSPPGCTWDEQQGGWWKADGSEWQRPKTKVPEPKVPKGPTKWTIAFEAELAARRAREEAVRFDGCTVYCAKHLYPLINGEKCSACADLGWRDTRHAPHPSTDPLTHVHISTRAAWQVRLLRRPLLRTHAL